MKIASCLRPWDEVFVPDPEPVVRNIHDLRAAVDAMDAVRLRLNHDQVAQLEKMQELLHRLENKPTL